MKQIINGLKYDTEASKLIYKKSNGLPKSNPAWVREDLYCTIGGKYFRHCMGGHDSYYSKRCYGADASDEGESIRPVDDLAHAMKWGEDNMSVEEYENAFGEAPVAVEDTELVIISVPLEIYDNLVRKYNVANLAGSLLVKAAQSKERTSEFLEIEDEKV